MPDLIKTIKSARLVSTPLIAITTPDYAATVEMISRATTSKAPKLRWDRIAGITPLNEEGKDALYAAMGSAAASLSPEEVAQATSHDNVALAIAARLPSHSIFIMLGVHHLVEGDKGNFEQAVWNLRDQYKQDRRTLFLLAPQLQLPVGLQSDVMLLDEPLPSDESLLTLLTDLHSDAGVAFDPSSDKTRRAVDALRGLAMFPADQAAAMSLTKNGLILENLWERKRQTVEQTPGIRFLRGGETFESLGGLERVKELGTRLFTGNVPPRVIVFVDEIEKMLGNAHQGGDTAGIQQDQLGVMLRGFDELEATGMIAVGPPGSGKSAFAKTLGANFGVPTLVIDLGAAKGSLVGQSEAMIRQLFKVIESIAGNRGAFFIATCNRLETIAPELKRRFRFGTWFFDLPDPAERKAIWKINIIKHSIPVNHQDQPHDADWTGADIAACCDLAYRMACPLSEAAGFLVPVAQSDPDSIRRMRAIANGTFASASHPGVYRTPDGQDGKVSVATVKAGRSFDFNSGVDEKRPNIN